MCIRRGQVCAGHRDRSSGGHGDIGEAGAAESTESEVATGRVCVDRGLHDVNRRSQSASPPALVPGVVKVFDMGTGWRAPEAGSIQTARHPADSAARFTEIVRLVGMKITAKRLAGVFAAVT